MQQYIKILLFHIYMKPKMFRATYIAHHQEPKTALAASGFQAQNVPDNIHQLHVQEPSTYEKPEAASAVLGSW
jgi:hypothetical protein